VHSRSNSVLEREAPGIATRKTVFWLEQTDVDVPPGDDWLSFEEVQQQNRLRFAKRRADWRLGRWTAKRAVSNYLGIPEHLAWMARIKVRAAPSGAPEIVLDTAAAAPLAARPPTPAISLSHSSGRALCAVAPAGVTLGCDLEEIAPRSDAFVADYFIVEEQAMVANSTPADRPCVSTLIWSAKESALKALCTGLRLDTRSLSVSFIKSSAEWHPLQVSCPEGRVFDGWWRQNEAFVRTVVSSPWNSNLPVQLSVEENSLPPD
jgi:4'-phosphopantetheinyl transferase